MVLFPIGIRIWEIGELGELERNVLRSGLFSPVPDASVKRRIARKDFTFTFNNLLAERNPARAQII